MEINPVPTATNDELAKYLCHYHNRVNKVEGEEPLLCDDIGIEYGRDDCDCDKPEDKGKKDTPNETNETNKQDKKDKKDNSDSFLDKRPINKKLNNRFR